MVRFKASILLIILSMAFLSACGGSESLRLNYTVSASQDPDLLFLVKLDVDGDGLIRFLPNLDGSTYATSYDQLELGRGLVSCALAQEDVEDPASLPTDSFFRSGSCADLGRYVGEVLFSDRAISGEGVRTDQELTNETQFIFFLAVFNASSLTGSPRCLQLFSFQKLAEGVRYRSPEGFVSSKNFNLEITEPNLGANCYAL